MARAGPFHQRLFADDHSAGGQWSWVPPGQREDALMRPGAWRREYRGALRFDSLLAERLVIPDSHLLDGAFLLSAKAEHLRREIGRPVAGTVESVLDLPIAFRLRRPTLDQTVREFLRTDGEHLNAFSFKAIPDQEARAALASALKARTWQELEPRVALTMPAAKAVGGFLRECLEGIGYAQQADAWIGPLEERWGSWLEIERSLRLERYPWGGFDLWGALRAERIDEDELSTAIGREAWAALNDLVSGDAKLRAQANATLAELGERATGKAERHDLARVNAVYSRVRYRAIAWQHGATFVRRKDPELAPIGAGERLLERVEEGYEPPVGRRLDVPPGVTQSLGELDDEAYLGYLHDNLETLREWWATGDLDLLRRATDALAEVVVAPRELPPAGLLLLIAGGAEAAAASPGLPGGLAAGVTTIVGGATYLAAERVAKRPQREMRRRIADAVDALGEPVVVR